MSTRGASSNSSKYSLNFLSNHNEKNGSEIKYSGTTYDSGLDSIKIDKLKVEELISNYKPCVKPNNFNFTFYDKSINNNKNRTIYNNKDTHIQESKYKIKENHDRVLTIEEVRLFLSRNLKKIKKIDLKPRLIT